MAKAKPIKGIHHNTPLLIGSGHMIETRLAEMLAYEGYVSNQNAVYELHQMRIAAKRLRYTLEIFQDAYDAYTGYGAQIKGATGEIEAIQEHLGAIHDADVMVPQLNRYLAHLIETSEGNDTGNPPTAGVHGVDYDACLGLITVCQRIRGEREKLYDKFLDHWQKLLAQNFFADLRGQLQDAAHAEIHSGLQPAPQRDETASSSAPKNMDSAPAPARKAAYRRTAESKPRNGSRQPVSVKAARRPIRKG